MGYLEGPRSLRLAELRHTRRPPPRPVDCAMKVGLRPTGRIATPKQSSRIIFCHGGENLGVELLLCWTLVPATLSVNVRLPVHPSPKVGLFLRAGAIVACKQPVYLLIRDESRRQISRDRVEV